MNIDVNKLNVIKDELDSLSDNDALFIDENNKAKYAIIPIETYDKVEDLLSMMDNEALIPQVKIIGADDDQLSYEEYERVKSLIMEAVEKTFKPKADKLN